MIGVDQILFERGYAPPDHGVLDIIGHRGDTAWLVYDDASLFSVNVNRALDRPCDTCDGMRKVYRRNPYAQQFVDQTGLDNCSADCIDGRHTFDIEVEGCGHDGTGNHICRGARHPYRVSIVPSMVLPIVRGACPDPTNAEHRRAHVHASTDESPLPVFGICPENSDLIFGSPWKSENLVTLPPAAAPGMWAVQLKVSTERID